jgi:signal transduction histidine kinase
MFEKFVRHDDKSLRGNNGSGLRLTIAEERVEMMNGKIGLESGPTLLHQRAVGGATRQRRRTLPNLEKEVAPTALLGSLRR